MFRSLHAVLAALVVCSALPAYADSLEAQAEAFSAGVKAIKERRWDDALRIYTDLWRERRSYDVALSLGQTEFKLERYAAAAEHLTFALENMPIREEPRLRERAKEMLDRAKQRVGSVTIEGKPDGTKLVLDEVAIGISPLAREVFATPGIHSFRASAEGYRPVVIEVTLVPGDRATVSFDLQREISAEDRPPPSLVSSRMPATARIDTDTGLSSGGWSTGKTITVVTGASMTLLGAGTGTFYGIRAASATEDRDRLRRQLGESATSACHDPFGPNAELCAELARAGDTRDSRVQTANVAFLIGGIAAIATLGTWLLWPDDAPSSSWLIAPTLADRSPGLFASGTF